MNKKISSDEFHNSIDRQLSGLKPDPWLAQHIMASAKEEEPVKKFTVSTALIVVLIVIATLTTALAASVLLGWTDFYSFEIPKTAQEILNATEPKDYQVGPITFTVNELLTDGHIALCSATSHVTDGSSAVLSEEVYDAVGANGDNGEALAQKWDLSPDTRWIDAAHIMNLPFYRVSISVNVPEECHDGEDMGDAMWDEKGNCVSYYMAALNSLQVGETLPIKLHFQVWQYDPQSIEPQSIFEDVVDEAKEMSYWEDTFEITLTVPAPIAEKTYMPEQPYDFENGLTLNSVTAQQTVAGAYVVGQFTLRDGFNFNDAYSGELDFLDATGEEIPWGMAESGIIEYDQLPKVEWGAMLNLEVLPEEMVVSLDETTVHVYAENK